MSICKKLSGTEIRILAGAYQVGKTLGDENKGNRTIVWWADQVAKNTGLATSEQVLRYEDNLTKQYLIMPSEGGPSASTWLRGAYGHRLSPLGLTLAELLSE